MTEREAQPDYSRQMLLKEVGAAGQASLGASRVLIVGAGGLGSPVLQYLAGAGVGCLGIIDGDTLEPSNLHRQPLYGLADAGQPKAVLAAAAVRRINPAVRTEAHAGRLTAANALALVQGYDVVVECSDNLRTKFLVNDAAVLAHKCAVFASVYQYEGQLQVYKPDAAHACLRCLWPEPSADGVVGNCAEAGVLGPVPGVLGGLQAVLTLKLLLGIDGQLGGEMLLVDLAGLTMTKLRTPRHAGCNAPGCSRISGLAPEPVDLELAFDDLPTAHAAGFTVIDIRNPDEVATLPSGVPNVPMNDLLAGLSPLAPTQRYLLLCASGRRSLAAAQTLRTAGIEAYSVAGGTAILGKGRT